MKYEEPKFEVLLLHCTGVYALVVGSAGDDDIETEEGGEF